MELLLKILPSSLQCS